MDERKAGLKPFQNSLAALAQIAQQEAGADGYALFRRVGPNGALLRHEARGALIMEEAVLASLSGNMDCPVAAYPLGDSDGLLALVFTGDKRGEPGRILDAIGSVWTAAWRAGGYSQLANDVADLETRLMDSKIADRVRGVLGHFDDRATDAILRHVESILRPPPARQILEQLSRELEQEVEERRLTNRAKTILQSVQGMSEEQAHAHLRKASRQSRRPLREIAVDVIDKHAASESRTMKALTP